MLRSLKELERYAIGAAAPTSYSQRPLPPWRLVLSSSMDEAGRPISGAVRKSRRDVDDPRGGSSE
jgi:hypothetical protein